MSANGWIVRRIGTEGWYDITHPRIPVVIQVNESPRVDVEEWGENALGLDVLVSNVAELVAELMNATTKLAAPTPNSEARDS